MVEAKGSWWNHDAGQGQQELTTRNQHLEQQLEQQRVNTEHWQIAAFGLAITGILVLVVGTAIGSKTRRDGNKPIAPAQKRNFSGVVLVKPTWSPKPVEQPIVDPRLTDMNAIERSAECLRYTALKAERWMSPRGVLREWFRLNCSIATSLAIPTFVVVPILTLLLSEVSTCSSLLVAIAKNLVFFPTLGLLAVAVVTGLVFVVRLVLAMK